MYNSDNYELFELTNITLNGGSYAVKNIPLCDYKIIRVWAYEYKSKVEQWYMWWVIAKCNSD